MSSITSLEKARPMIQNDFYKPVKNIVVIFIMILRFATEE